MRPLRIGLIGAGTIAWSAHLPAIARLRELVELVAIADVRETAAKRAAQHFGCESAYTDYRHLLDRADIDAVLICTPEFLHAEQAIAAAEAGKHILCEKPMAANLAEADAMLDACRRARVTLMVGHSRRFIPRYQRIHDAIVAGEVGDVRFVRENERRAQAMYTAVDQAHEYWLPREREGDRRPWLALSGFSQGAALTNAVHETDLFRWFTGSEAVEVYAESRITDPDGEVPDMLSTIIRFASGAIGCTEVVNRLPPGYPIAHMTEVVGTHGAVRAYDTEMATLQAINAQGTRFPANWGTLLHVAEAYVSEVRGFVQAVQRGGPPPLDPWDARQALAIAIALVRSSQEHRWVRLEEIGPVTRSEVTQ